VWELDEGYLIHDRGMKMIQGMYDDVLKTDDYKERIEIERRTMQSEAIRRRKAFIEAASLIPSLNITSADVDNNPWLLTVQNGTIELKSGVFREHRREDMITKMAAVAYDENADCPVWKQFIREIMDLFDNPVGYLTSLPKNVNFLMKSTFFVVFKRLLFRN
jgi:putative DNA primase/helicase